MRGFLIFLGLLLIAGGGAVAGAQYAKLDLSALDTMAGAKAFLLSQNALYAGAGTAGFGLLLIIIAASTGGKKREKRAKPVAKPTAAKQPAKAERDLTADDLFDPKPATPAFAPEVPRTVTRPVEQPPAPVTAASDEPPWSQPAPTPASVKPTASSQPPDGYEPPVATRIDPRLLNRRRVTDLVSINDALKAYHAQHGAYPVAEGLLGVAERGEIWIPGLAPDFIPRLPHDPATVAGSPGPRYVYASDGKNYKVLAQSVSLIGGTNVEVLGVRIDPTRQPTMENASFGFWTPDFASV